MEISLQLGSCAAGRDVAEGGGSQFPKNGHPASSRDSAVASCPRREGPLTSHTLESRWAPALLSPTGIRGKHTWPRWEGSPGPAPRFCLLPSDANRAGKLFWRPVAVLGGAPSQRGAPGGPQPPRPSSLGPVSRLTGSPAQGSVRVTCCQGATATGDPKTSECIY